MIGPILALVMLGVVVAVVRATSVRGRDEPLLRLMVGAFLLRLAVHAFSRQISLFSHGTGGDYLVYEDRALQILRLWSFTGVQYVTDDDLPGLGATSLPPNLYAWVANLNGGENSPLGGTAIIAALACLTCLNLYHLAIEIGADPRRTRVLTAVLLFSPALLLYTSDLYKDGLVFFFGIGAIGCAMRLARKFSMTNLLLGAVCLLALANVRSYLVFVTSAPLFVGLAGFRSRTVMRPLLAMIFLAAGFVFVAATTEVFDTVTESAQVTFKRGTAQNVLAANAATGSGVTFDDGGNPWGALGPKLAYMIFSPFPWSGGSLGFQIGKLDTFFWYYVLYRAAKGAKLLWRRDRTALLMLLSFIVPMTLAYASSFSNVGLSFRQRLIIVLLTSVLAAQSWPRTAPVTGKAPVRSPRAPLRAPLQPVG